MASELLKTKALSARIKEPKVRDFDFGLNLTSVESLIPDLPEPKPPELLDIQEQNRKGRLLDSLNKIGGGLEDSSLDFIRRQNFSNKGIVRNTTGYVKPLSPEDAKLFEITNPGEVWGEGRFGPGQENYQTRGNWVNDAPRKREILKKTKGLITEEEYAKILSDELGQEIKPKKVEGKFGNKQRTQFGDLSAKDFKGTYGSIKGGKTQGGSFKYYKPPTKSQIKAYKGALRSSDFNRLKPATVQAVLDLHKNYEQIYRKGNLPIIEDVVSKLSLSPGRAGRATVRLAQVYNGHQFKNPEFQDIRKNTSAANKIFAKMEAAPFGDVYRQGVYEAALETIDAKLGNEIGTFASFKSKARKLLNDNGITQKGFNFNEIAGVTGSSRSGAEFSQFVDIMEKDLNQKTLANLQGQLSTARQKIVKDPTKFKDIAKKFNLKASALEEKYNIELPKLIKPEDVKSSYGVKRLKELKEQGLDLVKAANRDSYGIKVPKGALTAKEFNDPNNKKVRELIALVGCPDFKGNQAFAEGGRIGFSEGTDCFNKGLKAVNEVKIKPGAQARNFAKFANRAYKLGRGIMKFGVIPEALFVGADSLIRMNLGDTLDESLYRAADFFIPGNQTDYADVLKIERTVGPEAAEVFRNVTKWRRKNEELQSLEQAEQADLALAGTDFAETNSGVSADETRKTYAGLKDKKRKEVLDASVSKDDQVLSQSYFDEAYDISKAKSTSVKMRNNVLEDESGLNVDLLAPEKNQQFQKIKNFREDMEFSEDDILKEINSNIQKGFYKNVEEAKLHYFQTLFAKKKFKEKPLSSFVLDDGYTPEQVYGTQGGEGFLNKINREKFIRPGTYEATPEEIDANFDMQDGIMAASGGRIGFADGPKNPGRRKFMKLAAGLASIPILGKFFKGAKVAKLIKPIPNSSTVMPDWFPNFVDKFVGRSIGKKIDADFMEYTNPDLPNIKLSKSDDGKILVEGTNEHNQAYNISYEPPGYEVLDYKTGKAVKTKGEFEAVEGRHVALGPEDYDTDAFYAEDLDDLFTSDIADMEKYTTGNVTDTAKDAFGRDTGLKKGMYDSDMAQGQAENRADILRDEGLDEID